MAHTRTIIQRKAVPRKMKRDRFLERVKDGDGSYRIPVLILWGLAIILLVW